MTPLSHMHPGAEILGTAIENLKNGRAMRYAPPWWPAAIGMVRSSLLFPRLPPRLDARAHRRRAGRGVARAGRCRLAAWSAGCCLLPLLTPLAAAWTFYAAAGARRVPARAPRSAQEAVAQFSRFVNPHVVRQLVERGGIETGRREVTLLFSDIRGFTTLSETRSPEEVVALLNRYFSRRSRWCSATAARSTSSSATASWRCGARRWTTPDHARRAVACALDMADTLQAFKRELGAEQSDFDVGIGLHSGPAVVGLIGSQKRREYTAIGDTVNLASRIEGLTKDAKRRILVSRDTAERCGDAFDFVSCGTFPVKGRAQPVELFEPRQKAMRIPRLLLLLPVAALRRAGHASSAPPSSSRPPPPMPPPSPRWPRTPRSRRSSARAAGRASRPRAAKAG